MKAPRTIKSWIAYILAPLLLIVLSLSVFRAIRAQPNLPETWNYIKGSFFSSSTGWLIAAFVGMIFNWGLEAAKWQRLLRHTEPVSFPRAFTGVLTGVSFTLFTPNRIGEYLGRIWYLSADSRGEAVSLSVAGGLAQLFITAICGMAAFEFLWRGGFTMTALPDTALALLLLRVIGWSTTIVLLLIYFNLGEVGSFLSRVKWLKSIQAWMEALTKFSMTELSTILGLSFLRYLVFLLQYFFLFQFFGVELGISLSFLLVAFLFLALALIPGVALAELGVRGQLSLWIVGAFSSNALGIVLTATTVWFINLILPALAGGAMMLKDGTKQEAHLR